MVAAADMNNAEEMNAMNYKGRNWRREVLRKRKIKYAIIDILLTLVWLVGTVCFAVSIFAYLLIRNWQFSLILCGIGSVLWFIYYALNHGTIRI